MKDTVKKAMLLGLVGVPVFMISCAVSTGLINGVKQSIQKHKNNK